MVAAKALVRGILIVGLAGPAAQAAPMLTLATTSAVTPGNSTVSYAPRFSPGFGLSLGTTNSSAYTPAPTPAPVAAPSVAPAPAPMMMAKMAVDAAPAAPMGQATADAFLNMGGGPYKAADSVTSGGAQGWWNSPQITRLFGGTPDAATRGSFDSLVVNRVEQTFGQSNVPLNLTTDPNAPAAHSLSVVSNTSSPALPNAIGMTQVGGDGFTFIDQAARAANNVDQLAWIVAHNVSHELMLAFGVQEVHDATGNFIDARNANWNMMTDPNAVFSESAARDLLTKDFRSQGNGLALAAQVIEPAPVPEPATIALWAVAASAVALTRARKGRKTASA